MELFQVCFLHITKLYFFSTDLELSLQVKYL